MVELSESILCIDREYSFISQDVEDYLMNNGGMYIIKEYEKSNTLNETMRRKLINILVDLLIQRYGLYPKSFEKTMLAIAAVKLFPKFKVDGTEHGTVSVKYFTFKRCCSSNVHMFFFRSCSIIPPKIRVG